MINEAWVGFCFIASHTCKFENTYTDTHKHTYMPLSALHSVAEILGLLGKTHINVCLENISRRQGHTAAKMVL